MVHRLGYIPDHPSIKDYTSETEEVSGRLAIAGEKPVAQLLRSVGITSAQILLPETVDLRRWCSPVENQGDLGSCTGMAAVGIIEYLERRASSRHTDMSRLFVYKVSRRLAGLEGDSGSYLRSTMEAITAFGAPPEKYWPYKTDRALFDKEPTTFCYAFAQNYKALTYYRLDPAGTMPGEILKRVKTQLSGFMPSMFGFTVYNSIDQSDSNGGLIPFPSKTETVQGGHAVVAVGYDDSLSIKNDLSGKITKGAFLIRNSWGTGWGVGGYGYLPYEYIFSGLADDWWSIIKSSWIDSGNFRI